MAFHDVGYDAYCVLGDPDAPAGTWHHWAAYDLPPTVTERGRCRAERSERLSRRLTVELLSEQPDHLPCSDITLSQQRIYDRIEPP